MGQVMTELAQAEDGAVVSIVYTNYKGETSQRRIRPSRMWFGSVQWHHGPQWILDAWDLDKRALRSFAFGDIRSWQSSVTEGLQ